MMIDAHNHPFWFGMTADKMVANMDAEGIDKTWLLSCETPESEFNLKEIGIIKHFSSDTRNMPFEHCVEYAEKYPERFILGYAPDPRLPYAIDRLQSAIDMYGVKVCGEVKYRMMADNCDAIKMYRFCGEKGLPVVMHIQRPVPHGRAGDKREEYWFGGDIDAFERAIKLCPETNFIGHAQSFWSEISGDGKAVTELYPKGKIEDGGKLIRLLETYDNLYCDISAGSGANAFMRDPEYGARFIEEFSDRMLYGIDLVSKESKFPFEFCAFFDKLLDEGAIKAESYRKIFRENAVKLLKL
jgi:predicted TIM-barrel fold metal-dependent hydrolase